MIDADELAAIAFDAYATGRMYLTCRQVLGVPLPGDPGVQEEDLAIAAARLREYWPAHAAGWPDDAACDSDEIEEDGFSLVARNARDPDNLIAGLDRHFRAQAQEMAAQILRKLSASGGETHADAG